MTNGQLPDGLNDLLSLQNSFKALLNQVMDSLLYPLCVRPEVDECLSSRLVGIWQTIPDVFQAATAKKVSLTNYY